MKRLSISLFAVLAIVVALTSAFTTSPKFVDNDFKVIAVLPSQVDDGETAIAPFDNNKITALVNNGILANQNTTPPYTPFNSGSALSTWLGSQTFAGDDTEEYAIVCDNETEFSCVGAFEKTSSAPVVYTFRARIEGNSSLDMVE